MDLRPLNSVLANSRDMPIPQFKQIILLQSVHSRERKRERGVSSHRGVQIRGTKVAYTKLVIVIGFKRQHFDHKPPASVTEDSIGWQRSGIPVQYNAIVVVVVITSS